MAVVGVKDESDLIGRCIDHLAAIGIDHVIAVDRGSTDGTLEWLEQRQSPDTLSLLRLPDDVALHREKSWPLIRAMADDLKADWLLFQDADEFWLPRSGSVGDGVVPATADAGRIDRYNAAVIGAGASPMEAFDPERYGDILLYVKPTPTFPTAIGDDPSLVWSQGIPKPKVMARLRALDYVRPGDHNADLKAGACWAAEPVPDTVIAHLPFTTFQRFATKVRNIRIALTDHPEFFEGSRASHWRRWAALEEQGRLREEYDRQLIPAEQVAGLRQDGVIASAQDILASRNGAG
jgi:hypothetical protein